MVSTLSHKAKDLTFSAISKVDMAAVHTTLSPGN
jgi:hypothetical protein